MTTRDAPPPRPRYGASGDDAQVWDRPAEPPMPARLVDALEPGTLRDELGGAAGEAPRGPPPKRIATFSFTGDGAEYFRIWIVNLLLTLLTLGVYSAWAKVRKTRYFWQNTRLDGHAFDYHGRPVAILIGRVIALVLVVAYSIAFDISRAAGLVVVTVLCVAGPWLFMRAQRFKLVNSSWRGLRFGFDASVAGAYRVVLPPLVIWFSSAVVTAVASDRLGLFAAAGVASSMLVPWMHHRLKRYQHDAARYGERRFSFLAATPSFYAVYFKAGLLATLGMLTGMTAVGLALGFGSLGDVPREGRWMMLFSVAGVLVFVYLAAWPYFAARLQAVVWSHTRLGEVKFANAIAALPLMRLVARNVALTLVTAGLYWPFASVALARYRVDCMRAESDEPITSLAEATSAGPGLAAGDAALDAFGLDIGL
jgi:uncharacterized membrane protein YjgN (DUF898 family)